MNFMNSKQNRKGNPLQLTRCIISIIVILLSHNILAQEIHRPILDWKKAYFIKNKKIKILINWDGSSYGLKHITYGQTDDSKIAFRQLARRAMQSWLSTGVDLELTGVEFYREGDDIGKDVILIQANGGTNPNGTNPGPASAKNRNRRSIITFYQDIRPSIRMGWYISPTTRLGYEDARWYYPILAHELGHSLGLMDIGINDGDSNTYAHLGDIMGDDDDGVLSLPRDYSFGRFYNALRGPSPYEADLLIRGNAEEEGYGRRAIHTGLWELEDDENKFEEEVKNLDLIRTYKSPDIAHRIFQDDYFITWVDTDQNVWRAISDGKNEFGVTDGTYLMDVAGQPIKSRFGPSTAVSGNEYAIVLGSNEVVPKPYVYFGNFTHSLFSYHLLPSLPGRENRLIGRPSIAKHSGNWIVVAPVHQNDFFVEGGFWNEPTAVMLWIWSKNNSAWSGPHKISKGSRNSQNQYIGENFPIGGVSVTCRIGFNCRLVYTQTGDDEDDNDNNHVSKLVGMEFDPGEIIIVGGSSHFRPRVIDTDEHGTISSTDPEISSVYSFDEHEIRWVAAYAKRDWSPYYMRDAYGTDRLSDTRKFDDMSNRKSEYGVGMTGAPGHKIMAIVSYVQKSTAPEPNLIDNGAFEDGLNNWMWLDYTGCNNIHFEKSTNYYVHAHIGSYYCYGKGYRTTDFRMAQSNLSIEQGKTYRVSFRAKGQANRIMRASVKPNWSTSYRYSGDNEIAITQSWEDFSFDFTMQDYSDFDARIQFDFGLNWWDVYIDDVEVREVN